MSEARLAAHQSKPAFRRVDDIVRAAPQAGEVGVDASDAFPAPPPHAASLAPSGQADELTNSDEAARLTAPQPSSDRRSRNGTLGAKVLASRDLRSCRLGVFRARVGR